MIRLLYILVSLQKAWLSAQVYQRKLDAAAAHNRLVEAKTIQAHNAVVLQDQQIELTQLKILEKRRALQLDVPRFTPLGYDEESSTSQARPPALPPARSQPTGGSRGTV